MNYIAISFMLFCTIGPIFTYGQTFEPRKGTLSVLNNQFHADYNKLVQKTISYLGDSTHPIIVFKGDSLLLTYRNIRKPVRVIPEQYHQLKAISHVPLTIFTMVSTWPEGKLSDTNTLRLQSYKSTIQTLDKELNAYSFSSSLLSRQHDILVKTLRFIELLQQEGSYEESDRNRFASSIHQVLLEDADEAARLELTELHQAVQDWLNTVDSSYIKNLYVVIGSSHQARYRQVAVQYFEKILNEKTSVTALFENKLVYAESVFDEAGCLSTLARHIIDQEIAQQFFGNKYRMQRDLMSDAATKYIKELFPEAGKKKQ